MNIRLRIRYATEPGTPSGRRGACRPPHHWLMPCATTSCAIDLTAAARKVPAMITGALKSNVVNRRSTLTPNRHPTRIPLKLAPESLVILLASCFVARSLRRQWWLEGQCSTPIAAGTPHPPGPDPGRPGRRRWGEPQDRKHHREPCVRTQHRARAEAGHLFGHHGGRTVLARRRKRALRPSRTRTQ
jgi:hypothetical protein